MGKLIGGIELKNQNDFPLCRVTLMIEGPIRKQVEQGFQMLRENPETVKLLFDKMKFES